MCKTTQEGEKPFLQVFIFNFNIPPKGRVQKKPLNLRACSYMGGGVSCVPNSIFHIVSHLSDHLDQSFHLKFVEFVPSVYPFLVYLAAANLDLKKTCFLFMVL